MGEPSNKAAPDEVDVPKYVLYPEYAIGMQVISRDEYNALRDEYYTQATLLTGIALPLILLLLLVPRLAWWLHVATVAAILVGITAGMDRLHKFYSELQTLIISRYVAKKQADDKAAAAATATAALVLTKTHFDHELKKQFDQMKREMGLWVPSPPEVERKEPPPPKTEP